MARHRQHGDTKHTRFASQQYNHPGRFRANNLPDTADYLRVLATISPPRGFRSVKRKRTKLRNEKFVAVMDRIVVGRPLLKQ